MADNKDELDLFGDPKSLNLWNDLFRAQVDTSFASELPAFHRSRAWHSAKDVVDLATGNGYFISKLAAVFEDKSFVAIDSSQAFIGLALASKSTSMSPVKFVCRDLFEESNDYDFAILRAVARHQQSFEKLLKKLSDLVRPKGSALLIDLDDFEGVFFWPPAPEISNIYSRVAERQRMSRVSGVRNHAELVSLARQLGKWDVLSDERVVVSSAVGQTAELLKRQFSLLLKVFEQVDQLKQLTSDYREAGEAWSKWCERPCTYLHVALRITELGRK